MGAKRIKTKVTLFKEATVTAFPSGVFDYSESNSLISELLHTNNENADISIDFKDVNSIDSSGIGALILLHKQLPESSRPVHLVNLPDSVLNTLKRFQLQKICDLRET